MHGMRPFPPLLLAALCAALCIACGRSRRPTTTAATGHLLTVDERALATGGSDTLRLGRLHEGETAVLPLRLHNATPRPLLLTGYERTCGCTELAYDERPIPPDSIRPLSLRFDTRGTRGWQLKLVTLRLGGAGAPFRLYVEADVD